MIELLFNGIYINPCKCFNKRQRWLQLRSVCSGDTSPAPTHTHHNPEREQGIKKNDKNSRKINQEASESSAGTTTFTFPL